MMEALLSFFRRQVGLRTDTASTTGSLHAKAAQLQNDFKAGFVPGGMMASDNLKYSDDAEEIHSVSENSPYVKRRGLRVYRSGSVRVAFDAMRVDVRDFTAKIHIDGVAVGAERSVSSSYTTFTEDFAVAANSLIEIYVKNNGSSSWIIKTRNYRLYFDATTTEAIGAGKIY